MKEEEHSSRQKRDMKTSKKEPGFQCHATLQSFIKQLNMYFFYIDSKDNSLYHDQIGSFT